MTTLGSVRIRGTVRRGGAPIEGAYLTLNDGSDLIAERRTGPDGAFEFHISPGNWTITCRAAGSDPKTLTVDSGGGDVALDFEL